MLSSQQNYESSPSHPPTALWDGEGWILPADAKAQLMPQPGVKSCEAKLKESWLYGHFLESDQQMKEDIFSKSQQFFVMFIGDLSAVLQQRIHSMGNELFCCSDEAPVRSRPTMVASKQLQIKTMRLPSITEEPSMSEPTINILQPRHERHSGKSMPEEHSHHRDTRLSESRSQKPHKCCQLLARESQFHKVASLGSGNFGRVYLVKPSKANCLNVGSYQKCTSACGEASFAMKVIPKRKIDEELSVHSLMLQRKILATIKSNFIVDLKYAFQNHKSVFFVMDYAPGGDLYSFLDNPFIPEKVRLFKDKGEDAIRFVTASIVLALECLHNSNIIYRDLKPENVLVFRDGYVKLCDFGLAEEQYQDQIVNPLAAGTKIYLAPEIVDDGLYTRLIDLWSLGVFVHELVFGKPPFPIGMIVPNKFKKIARKAQSNRTWPQEKASAEVKDFIDRLLKVRPQERIGAENFDDIKSHKFFEGFCWNKLNMMQMASPLKSIVDQYGSTSRHPLNGVDSSQQQDERVNLDLPHFNYHHNEGKSLSTLSDNMRCV